VNLKQLSEDVWLANHDTILSGSDINFENITLEGKVFIMVKISEMKDILHKKDNIDQEI